MKRIITLALAAGLFLGASVQANAAEINISGKMVMTGAFADDLDLIDGGAGNADFDVHQRLEVGIDIVNSENLKAHIRFRAPSNVIWGSGPLSVGGGNLSILLKQAYVDWFVPTTDVMVRMGLQPVHLPTTLGSPVIDDTMAGVSVIAPINDMVTFTAHWFRPWDTTTNGINSESVDVFAITVPMNFDGFSVTPWAAYALAGENLATPAYMVAEDNWWIGFASQFNMFDPFTFAIGAAYGRNSDINTGLGTSIDASGWIVDAKFAYATMYGTPALFGWYASGDDYQDSDLGRLIPVQYYPGGGNASGWGNVTTAFFDQSQHGIAPTAGVTTPAGTWALGLSYSGFQPMDDLTLGGHVMWVNGTNELEPGSISTVDYMDKDASVVELAAYATYEIYKDLQAAFEVNYLIEDLDNANGYNEDGLRVLLGVKYDF